MKKLCKDCKYYKKYYGYGGSNGIYDECTSPQTIKEKDVVRGLVHMNFCMYERLSRSDCGPDAKYFEQYEPPVYDKPWWTKNLEKLKKPFRIMNTIPDDAPWLDTTYDGFNEEELKEKLEVMKKKNFQSVAIACMAEYSRVYGEMPKEDYDAIMKAINEPPKYIEGLANLMKRKLP